MKHMNKEVIKVIESILAKIEHEKKQCANDDYALKAGLLKAEIVVREELINQLKIQYT